VSTWATDALWLGPHICTRLREQVPELREVFVLDDLVPGQNDPKHDPAAVVLLDSLVPPGSDPLQSQALAEQGWLVLLAVRSVRKDGDRNRQLLGPLVTQTVRAMQGWCPPGSKRAFTWRRGPRPDYGKDISYFPLLFNIQMVAA